MIPFLEIEHKFLVSDAFDLKAFSSACRALSPTIEKALVVTDTYYVPADRADHIFRHRRDEEIQQLTIKSRGKDIEVRTEINLDLGGESDQSSAVEAWMKAIGASPAFPIEKHIQVFEFPMCEVVHYVAHYEGKQIACVEFEAVGSSSLDEAIRTLTSFEQKLGFDAHHRSKVNLFDLLITDRSLP
ncbi:MAG: hypothetical protein OSA37_07520 [Flavobacteriales bacterium]|nr:hypothetical protein [Flavobacteriales bacterium]